MFSKEKIIAVGICCAETELHSDFKFKLQKLLIEEVLRAAVEIFPSDC